MPSCMHNAGCKTLVISNRLRKSICTDCISLLFQHDVHVRC
jgi:hypothetical protein